MDTSARLPPAQVLEGNSQPAGEDEIDHGMGENIIIVANGHICITIIVIMNIKH